MYDLKPGGAYQSQSSAQMRSMGLPEVIIDGEVVEVNPPLRLVHTLRFLFSEQNKAEGFTRITWEIEPTGGGFCRVTVTHELERDTYGMTPIQDPPRRSRAAKRIGRAVGKVALQRVQSDSSQ